MIEFWIALVAGFLLLMWSADRFVLGSAATARNLGIAPIIIGMTIMGFGTSTPELLVAGDAAWNNNPGLGIGNAIGSNIANIALVLGIASLVAPMSVDSNILRREFPVLIFVMLLALGLMFDGELSRLDGIILITAFTGVMCWMIRLGLQTRAETDRLQTDLTDEIPSDLTMKAAIFWIIVGLLVLVISSHLLVWGATGIAKSFGISDLVIGLTIVAIGTSLPELAASVSGALKGEHEIALGNIIGSNIFNTLAVLGLTGVIKPNQFMPEVLHRDFPVMIGVTVVLFFMAYGFRGPGRINRVEGGILVSAFGSYMFLIYLATTS